MLETNLLARITAAQVKQSALQVQTAGGFSLPTIKVEERSPNALSLQLTPSKESC